MARALTALAALLLAASAEAQIETYRLPRAAAPPGLDGLLNDACWRSALTLTDFGLLGRAKAKAKPPATACMMCYDADYLYVAFRCAEPTPDRLKLKIKRHDGPTWMDDCVEIFFNPSGDRERYVQTVVNAAGVIMDAYFPRPGGKMDRGYESGVEAVTKIGKSEWTMEARFPFAGLPLTGPRETWTFHMARSRRAGRGEYLTSLKSHTGGYHDIARFDRLIGIDLPERPIGLVRADLGELFRGRNIARATLRNWGKRKVTAKVSAGVAGNPREERAVALAPGKTATVEVPWRLAEADAGKRVSLDVRTGGRLQQRRALVLPPLKPLFGDPKRRAHFMYADAPVTLDLPVRVAEGDRDGLRLRWQARDAAGRLVGRGLTSLRDVKAVLRLYWPRWRSSRYTLQLELLRQGKAVESAERTILLVENPWREDG